MPAASSIPPALPPSVEEAYRRKCIQLKQRTNEVEEANDAARTRLVRLKRQVEKMRLERAFLLEQLAKRTSTNVEDSDGSPSPPPTPKEKPLRIKRGHRKPSLLANSDAPTAAGTTFISQNPHGGALSPSSDAFSAPNAPDSKARANGMGGSALRNPPRKPGTAFDLYCAETRAELFEKNKDKEDFHADEALETAWKELSGEEQKAFEERSEKEMARYEKAKDEYDSAATKAVKKSEERDANTEAEGAAGNADGSKKRPAASGDDTPRATQDEDVDRANDDTDQEETAQDMTLDD